MTQGVALSIVTVTYNDLDGLARTEASIAMQSNISSSEFEWVVVDGDSNDGTKSWLATTDHVTRFVSEPDGGVYDAMNKGIRMAKGPFILFLNAGDYLADESVLTDLVALTRSEKVDIIFGSVLLSSGDRLMRRPARDASYINHGLPGYHQATIYSAAQLDPPLYDSQYEVSADYFVTASILVRAEVRPYVWDRDIAVFELGGLSSQRQLRLTYDCALIQRRVLGLRWTSVLKSALRRQVGNKVNRLFTVPLISPVVQRITELLDPQRADRPSSKHL